MKDLSEEIAEIGDLITSTMFLTEVRREVYRVRKEGFIVTDGKRAGASEFDVVVRSLTGSDKIARRIREKMPDARVERIAEGVLGISEARRGDTIWPI